MTIVYLHPHFTIAGGSGRFVLETANRLERRGHTVHIITIRADEKVVGEAGSGIHFHEIGGPLSSQLSFWLTFPQSCSRIDKVIRSLKAPILFPQVFPANWWGFHVRKRRRDLPCVWFCHEPSAFIHSRDWIAALPTKTTRVLARLGNPLLRWLDTSGARHVDLVFTNSFYTRAYAQSVYGYPDELVRTVYLGVDHQRFTPSALEVRKRLIVTTGKLTRFKNIDTTIRAVASVIRSGVNAELEIIGTGDAEGELKELAASLGISNHVHFCGAVDDAVLVQVLQEARAFVLASVDEPFGLVTVEALACGTPAVVVNRGGPAEVVVDSESGYQVPPRDSDTLAERLKILLTDDAEFGRLSLSASIRAREFSWDRTVDELERGFHDVENRNKLRRKVD
jgi:glycosyltransferase involved in cell wall biosynthesis